MSLPSLLIQLRKSAGFSQKDMAEKLHITRQAYARYEKGVTSPNIRVVLEIAAIHHMSPADLVEMIDL